MSYSSCAGLAGRLGLEGKYISQWRLQKSISSLSCRHPFFHWSVTSTFRIHTVNKASRKGWPGLRNHGLLKLLLKWGIFDAPEEIWSLFPQPHEEDYIIQPWASVWTCVCVCVHMPHSHAREEGKTTSAIWSEGLEGLPDPQEPGCSCSPYLYKWGTYVRR